MYMTCKLIKKVCNKVLDSADSKSLIPLSFLADAPAACDAVFGACAGSQPGAFPSAMHGINLDRW